MSITFQINYRTQWGETLCVIAFNDNLLQWTEQTPLALTCQGQDFWSATAQVTDFVTEVSYKYAVRKTDGSYYYEGGKPRHLTAFSSKKVVMRDFWQVDDYEKSFYTTAFCKALFRRQSSLKLPKTRKAKSILLSIDLPQILPTQGVAVMGSNEALGCWNAEKKLVMSDADYPVFKAVIDAKGEEVIEYKYVIFDIASGNIVDMEYGENRQLWGLSALYQEKQSTQLRVNDRNFRRTQPRWKGAGVAIPVFSLRTDDGFGIGEFQDLKKMADWAASVGMKMIQTLPINDTTLEHTNRDSYPYNAVSVFALHPIYINVEKMGKLTPAQLKKYKATQAKFNAKTFADYQVVYDEKTKYFKALFKAEKDSVFASDAFKAFFEKNKTWLEPYAKFLSKRDKQPVEYYYFLQFHADQQLADAVAYAHSVGVALKGDIPIGISPLSVDAAVNPELFNLDASAGAPPDAFDARGQNWGFPTYNWDVMAKDDYAWWKQRFTKMQDYFDAYRIDHILGFFRIWQMPKSAVWGLCGHFVPALPYSMQDLWNMGVKLDENRLTKPYIQAHFLGEIFGDKTEEVKNTYFNTQDGVSFCFKPEYDTQVKVQNMVEDETVRNGLLYLHCEVLFVRDQQNPQMLHPRIALYQSHSFSDLWDDQKQVLMSIHDDYFYRRHTQFWRESALRKLPTLINATDMLVCGEDLGMVPACVPDVMKELQILSLEIQRMPKDPTIDFAHPAEAPYLSVCTTGTHDTNPLRAWWEEDVELTQKFYNHQMGWSGEAPKEMTPEIAEFIVNQHMFSPAMWVILPLQDWMAVDANVRIADQHADRINLPSNPRHFWNYRMHLSIEDLMQKTEFNAHIRKLIEPRS